MPNAALMIGSRIYSHRLTTCEEDFDDALLYLWFEEEMVAEIQVGRNHVAGYRTESVIYGEEGVIQVDRLPSESSRSHREGLRTARPVGTHCQPNFSHAPIQSILA